MAKSSFSKRRPEIFERGVFLDYEIPSLLGRFVVDREEPRRAFTPVRPDLILSPDDYGDQRIVRESHSKRAMTRHHIKAEVKHLVGIESTNESSYGEQVSNNFQIIRTLDNFSEAFRTLCAHDEVKSELRTLVPTKGKVYMITRVRSQAPAKARKEQRATEERDATPSPELAKDAGNSSVAKNQKHSKKKGKAPEQVSPIDRQTHNKAKAPKIATTSKHEEEVLFNTEWRNKKKLSVKAELPLSDVVKLLNGIPINNPRLELEKEEMEEEKSEQCILGEESKDIQYYVIKITKRYAIFGGDATNSVWKSWLSQWRIGTVRLPLPPAIEPPLHVKHNPKADRGIVDVMFVSTSDNCWKRNDSKYWWEWLPQETGLDAIRISAFLYKIHQASTNVCTDLDSFAQKLTDSWNYHYDRLQNVYRSTFPSSAI